VHTRCTQGEQSAYIECSIGRTGSAHIIATFSQLPSGHWYAQVRRGGLKRNATFPKLREAKTWAAGIESQAHHIATGGYAPVPKEATLGDLIDKCREMHAKEPGKTKAATLDMLKREIGKAKLSSFQGAHSLVLVDFIDRRIEQDAGGVTIAGDLSTLSEVLKWGRHARKLDINDKLALDARASLKFRGLDTRSQERDREPTDDELQRLFAYWEGNPKQKTQKIDMPMICRFALATGMRQSEICGLQIKDVDALHKTVIIRDRKDPRNKKGNDQTVPLLQDAWTIMQPLLEGRTEGEVFQNVHASSVSTDFTRACKALGIEDLHFHDLRHRATAQFFRMGLGIPQVALMTGHKTWAMLRRYTNIKAGDVHAAIASHQMNN
jgi:integrase